MSGSLDQLRDFSGFDGLGMFFLGRLSIGGAIGPPGGGGAPGTPEVDTHRCGAESAV